MNTPDQNVREQVRQILNWYDCSSPRGVDGIAGQTAIDGLLALIDQISAERERLGRVEARKLTHEEDKYMSKNAHQRGKTVGAVLALDELKRDVMAVAVKYDDETNTIWLGNLNRIREAALRQPSGEEGK